MSLAENLPETVADVMETALLGYSRARSINYTLQFFLFNSLSSLLPGNPGKGRPKSVDAALLAKIRSEVLKLFKEDAHNIRMGVYPASVLAPERAVDHVLRFPKLFLDGISIYRRRLSGKTSEFGKLGKDLLDDLPRYYRRNFHFQTDGYLSTRSAELYEHQVELLFGGSADAMRRLVITELRKKFGNSDGKGLRFLEIGAGTGRSTRFVHLAFPKAKIVASDLSDPYLKEAQKKLSKMNRIDFMQADGTALPFRSESFDAVYSIFMYHELPLAERRAVLAESRRVLKPGGVFSLVDSLQTGDLKELDEILQEFPKQFHEPYYRDYVSHPMEKLVEEAGFSQVTSRLGFVSKVCSAISNPV